MDKNISDIRVNVKTFLDRLPPGVELVAAAKMRSPEEVAEAVFAGAAIIGENYVQEAEEAFAVVGNRARWHFIGHLQKNKIKKAVEIFDLIETVDSEETARQIDKRAGDAGKVMPVLIEINSGREEQKFGVFPEAAGQLVKNLAALKNIRISGLMTMGPESGTPESFRPYFRTTREIFEKIKSEKIPGVEMKYLSMGMTASYKVAIEEGANLVRIGTGIFGERRKG